MIDSIGFDLDGTLWDYAGCYRDFFIKATEHIPYAHKPAVEEIYAVTGRAAIDYLDHLYPELVNEPLEEKLRIFRTAEQIGCDMILKGAGRLYEGLEEMLSKLSAKYKLFIASNCEPLYLQNFLKYYDFSRYFTDVICQDLQAGLKTKGQNIMTVCERNGLLHPVFVGDAQSDADAAKEAGIPFVWASYGYGTVQSPAFTIHNPLDLVSLTESF